MTDTPEPTSQEAKDLLKAIKEQEAIDAATLKEARERAWAEQRARREAREQRRQGR